MSVDITTLLVTVGLGFLVLTSYYIVFIKLNQSRNYLTHPFWFDTSKNAVIVFIVFQLLAVVGFLVAVFSWIVSPPKRGVMGNRWYALPLTMAIFLITATIWPFAVHYTMSWVVVISIIGTAICSILLLAGSIEEDNQRWWVILGFLLLSVVTVLIDGVLWNANYIQKRF